MKTHLILSICILLTTLIGIANAGLMITTQDEEGMAEATIYQDGVIVSLDDNKKAMMIVDSQKSQCTWFNHSSQKFARGCPNFTESINEIKAMGDEAMKSIMSNFSPEQQAMMRQNMENEEQSRPPLQTKKIGRTDFQGFSVNKYHLLFNGNPVAEVWLSPDLYKALSKEVDIKAIDKIFGESDDEHDSGFGHGGMQESLEKEIDALAEKEHAFVIKQMQIMSQNNPSDTEMFGSQVIEIKTKKFDLDQYKPPSSYEEVESFFGLSGFIAR